MTTKSRRRPKLVILAYNLKDMYKSLPKPAGIGPKKTSEPTKTAPLKKQINSITKGKRVPRKTVPVQKYQGKPGPNGEESQYFRTGPTLAEENAMTKKANK